MAKMTIFKNAYYSQTVSVAERSINFSTSYRLADYLNGFNLNECTVDIHAVFPRMTRSIDAGDLRSDSKLIKQYAMADFLVVNVRQNS